MLFDITVVCAKFVLLRKLIVISSVELYGIERTIVVKSSSDLHNIGNLLINPLLHNNAF